VLSKNKITTIAKQAGKAILEEYHKKETPTDWKADDSPLTLADKKAHNVIVKELQQAFPTIPVLSEEGKTIAYNERKNWTQFWCVDPMDGTKEFIKKTGQFTVNIALIENGKPVMGVIYVPVMDLMYYAQNGKAYKQESNKTPQHIQCREANKMAMAFVASKDHAGPKVKALTEQYKGAELLSMGSSLKFCLVAEGKADAYLRDVPTYEWDTAAAQAIVEAAGGRLCTLDGNPLAYNKENILNPEIITVGKGQVADELLSRSISL
jgi:3'(2'), 5'-bisphosphate nucleotidase